MAEAYFEIPYYLDYGATFFAAVSGGLVAARRGYDALGVIGIAFIASTGGGLLRDGLFLQSGPPLLVESNVYLILVLIASVFVLTIGRRIRDMRQFPTSARVVDALGMGAYAVMGMQLSIAAGLATPAVVLVGVVNGAGGGLLRDVVMSRDPDIFTPGTITGVAVLAGCLVYVLLRMAFGLSMEAAAWPAIIVTFGLRMGAIWFDIRTGPIRGLAETGENDKSGHKNI